MKSGLSVKTNVAVLCIGLALGAYLHKVLVPKPKPVAIVATQTDTKIKIVKVTEPSGKIVEVTESVSSKSFKPMPISKHKYGIGLLSDKSIYGEIRIADWDLFLIGTASKDGARIGLKWEF